MKHEVNYINDIPTSEDLVRAEKIKDRIFVEEVCYRFKNRDFDYVNTLLCDLLSEMIEETPMTEDERKKHIYDICWDENVWHFKSDAEALDICKNYKLK